MLLTLIQMAALIGCGVGWRYLQPAGLAAEQTRLVLTSVVYNLFLPALILLVLWQAHIGIQTIQYAVLCSACIVFGIASIWLMGGLLRFENARLGAIMLAASFPNITYLGLPVLEQTFGSWARSVAIQMDLFAGTPLLFTLGIMIAVYYGQDNSQHKKSAFFFLYTPPFLAAALAIVLAVNDVPMPEWIAGMLQRLADVVVPLMLISIGLALNWQSVRLHSIPYVLPVIIVKMILMPAFALWLIRYLDIEGEYKSAAVLEMAMPSMVLGIVFCDKYRLDTPLYAMAVAVTTVISLFTLPFWYELVN